MKRIKYCGFELDVPPWAKWIGYTPYGEICVFDSQPTLRIGGYGIKDVPNSEHLVYDIRHRTALVTNQIMLADWQNSLQKIDQLTVAVVMDEPIAPHVELEDSQMHTQVGGSHYKDMAIQPVEFIHKNGIGYMEGNVIKYVSRWREKNGLEDLKKARHYIDLLIEMESGKNGESNNG